MIHHFCHHCLTTTILCLHFQDGISYFLKLISTALTQLSHLPNGIAEGPTLQFFPFIDGIWEANILPAVRGVGSRAQLSWPIPVGLSPVMKSGIGMSSIFTGKERDSYLGFSHLEKFQLPQPSLRKIQTLKALWISIYLNHQGKPFTSTSIFKQFQCTIATFPLYSLLTLGPSIICKRRDVIHDRTWAARQA